MADQQSLTLEAARPPRAKRDILYVDDEPDNGIVFEAEFGGEFNVWCAESAQQAMQLLARHEFPVVVSDHRMPRMTGAELFHLMRSQYPRTKQIMLSGYSDCPEVTEAINRGQIHWFAKPWCRNSLYPVLLAAIEAHDLLVMHDEVKLHADALRRAEQVMQQATAAANAANRSKSEFLTNMSHEIRTPLTAIMGFADILLGEVGQLERCEAARTIKRNGEYLLEIVNEILDLSRIEAGKLPARFQRVSPGQLLVDVVRLMEVRSAAKGLPLLLEMATPLPATIDTDPVRLRQILINLVGNAIKFTDTGSVRVVARLVEHQTASALQIDVIDTGIGLSNDELPQLFRPFNQVDTSHTRRYGGTGLGLVISQRLAEILGGSIQVESVPGQGSTFSLSIAVGELDGVELMTSIAADGVEVAEPVKAGPEAPAPLRDARLLLAEDGPDNQRIVSAILQRAGAHVALVENGQLACELILGEQSAGNPFDVVLMDMQMPVLDGYSATVRLRDAGYRGPIVALTAHAMTGDRERYLEAGCDDFLTKPIDRARLVDTVARYLAKGR